MKKLLALLLVATLLCSMFASCGSKKSEDGAATTAPPATVTYDLDGAAAYVQSLYKEDLNVTAVDYPVVSQVMIGGVTYQIDWSVDTDKVTVGTPANGEVIIDVNEKSPEEVSYKLTATIKAGDGSTKTVTFKLSVPKYAVNSHAEYMAAQKDDKLTIEGIVVAINSKDAGNKYNHLFLADTSVTGGYYCYSVKEDPAKLGIKVGMTVSVTGDMSPYSGMQEIKDGQVAIVDSSIKEVKVLDITDQFASGADLGAYVGLPVTIKGVTIGTQELEKDTSQYLNFKLNDKTAYVRTYVTDFPTSMKAEDKAGIDKDHADHFGYKADATGILVLYNSAPYLIPMSATPFTNYVEVKVTDADKVATELEGATLDASLSSDTVIDLPTTGKYYSDVTLSWATDDTTGAATIKDGKLTIVVPDKAITVNVTVTATCKDATNSKTLTIKLSKTITPIKDIVEIGSAKEHNTYTEEKYIAGGIIVEIQNTTYGNMIIQDESGASILVYGTYLNGKKYGEAEGTKPVVGDYVVLMGVVGQYNGTAQIKNADITSFTSPSSIKDAAAAGAAKEHNTYTEEKYLVTGEITEIANDKYGNLYIKDADGNTLYIYGVYTQNGTRFDGMATKPAVGDTITVLSIAGKYNDTVQLKNATLVAITAGKTDDTPDDPAEEPDVWDGTTDVSWYTGDKTEYVLTTAEQFAGFFKLRQDQYNGGDKSGFAGVTIKLARDLILNEGTLEDLKANGGNQITALNSNASFYGVFDGQGHTIKGVYLDCTGAGVKALFGGLGDNCVIKDLKIDIAYFNGSEKDKNTGAILAARANGTNILISNVTITNVLMEESSALFSGVGILVGKVDAGKSLTLENCHTSGVINFPTQGTKNIGFGGLVGYLVKGTEPKTDDATGAVTPAVNTVLTLKNCSSSATITGTNYVGGLLGRVYDYCEFTADSQCKFTGTLTVTEPGDAEYKGEYVSNVEGFQLEGPVEMTIPEALAAADDTQIIVKGTVKEINTAWSEQYNNISVTIVDAEGNTLYLFRLATNVKVGDKITVTGKMTTYKEARQVAAGATATIDEAAPVEMTIPEALAAADNTAVIVKGTVKEINTAWSEQYNNISVTIEDAEGNTLYLFRLATNVKVGDKITVTGKMTTYKEARQIAAGATAEVEAAPAEPIKITYTDANFSTTLPAEFAGANAIKIEGSNCETGCTDIFTKAENSQYHLSTVGDVPGASAMGVIKLINSGIYHYYIDTNASGCKAQNGGNTLEYSQCYIRWSFTVAEAGTYQIASYHRVKQDKRAAFIQIDDQAKINLEYQITDLNSFVDGAAGAYLTWDGVEVELAAGEHTITYTLESGSSWHWRAIYLVKKA